MGSPDGSNDRSAALCLRRRNNSADPGMADRRDEHGVRRCVHDHRPCDENHEPRGTENCVRHQKICSVPGIRNGILNSLRYSSEFVGVEKYMERYLNKTCIDFHAHCVTDAFRRAIEALGIDPIAEDGFSLPSWSAEEHLTFMDNAGIDFSVLTTPVPHIYNGDGKKHEKLCMPSTRKQQKLRAGIRIGLPLRDWFLSRMWMLRWKRRPGLWTSWELRE